MGINRVFQVTQMDTMSSSTIALTTAGTAALIPSVTAGTIYITDIIVGNGATAGSFYFGVGSSIVAPTTSAILIQSIYLAANTAFPLPGLGTPIPITPNNNFLVTTVSCTTMGLTVIYYVTR